MRLSSMSGPLRLMMKNRSLRPIRCRKLSSLACALPSMCAIARRALPAPSSVGSAPSANDFNSREATLIRGKGLGCHGNGFNFDAHPPSHREAGLPASEALREIARLIDVRALEHRHVVGEEL